MNHRGIAGSVILNLTDANYDTTVANGSNRFPILLGPVTGSSAANSITVSKSGTPATISYRGSTANGQLKVIMGYCCVWFDRRTLL
ncbi:MAG: hypothetical protein IPM91_06935 [Bacteroidetes bacterium]|nr:hypothetical protein [Bacteroidota bacterium]